MLHEAKEYIKNDDLDWLSTYRQNLHQPEIFETRALFYRILVTHKETGLLFEKIGLIWEPGKEEDDFDNMWNQYKWSAFKIEPIDKIECNFLEANIIEALFQKRNAHKKITIPSYVGFNINKTYETHFIWAAKSKTIPVLRDIYLHKQKGLCAICNKPVKDETLDHMHQKKVKGTGFIRQVLCNTCNTFLARVENNAARHNLTNDELPDVLRRMAQHLESQKNVIHPTEVPKRKKVGKREWNRIVKYYFKAFPNRKTLPKKPVYVTEKFLELKQQIENYIQENEKKRIKK
jgi:hypothetical protein